MPPSDGEQTRSNPTVSQPGVNADEPATPVRNKKLSSPWLKIAVIAFVAALVGGTVGAQLADGDDGGTNTSLSGSVSSSEASNASATPGAIRSVLDRVQPAVVSIRGGGPVGSETGTGMIISADGEILTNAHVVSGVQDLQVTLNGEREPRSATLVGADPTIDSAIIRLDDASDLPSVQLGESSSIQVGDQVVAIGNALALAGGPTVTTGIVSARDRSIENLDGLIQTDAAINPGNSGGPLVNMAGEVIGMNTAVIRGNTGEFQNIGFALGIDIVKPAIPDLQAGRTTELAYLGVTSATLSEQIKANFDLFPDSGAVIDSVQPGSAADEGGLSRFDVITELGGQEIRTSEDLVAVVRDQQPGDEVTVVYFRGSERLESNLTLGSRPPG
jgi:S1-C subfamily serine protease